MLAASCRHRKALLRLSRDDEMRCASGRLMLLGVCEIQACCVSSSCVSIEDLRGLRLNDWIDVEGRLPAKCQKGTKSFWSQKKVFEIYNM